MRDASHAHAVFADGSQYAGDEGAMSLEAPFRVGIVILVKRRSKLTPYWSGPLGPDGWSGMN